VLDSIALAILALIIKTYSASSASVGHLLTCTFFVEFLLILLRTLPPPLINSSYIKS
jgi:hypothetical protein